MTVKEMINELMDCNLDSEVTIELKTDQYDTYTRAEYFKIVDYIGGVVIEEVAE